MGPIDLRPRKALPLARNRPNAGRLHPGSRRERLPPDFGNRGSREQRPLRSAASVRRTWPRALAVFTTATTWVAETDTRELDVKASRSSTSTLVGSDSNSHRGSLDDQRTKQRPAVSAARYVLAMAAQTAATLADAERISRIHLDQPLGDRIRPRASPRRLTPASQAPSHRDPGAPRRRSSRARSAVRSARRG